MDGRHIDMLARSLSAAPSRRGLLAGLLAALGLGPAAEAKPGGEGKSTGKGRGGRGGKEHGRNRGNGHGNGNGRNRKGKRCDPGRTDAEVCAGKCGPRDNNCGRRVDCTALCAGCCDGGTCVAPTTRARCGTGGGACAACDADRADGCSEAGACVCGNGLPCDASSDKPFCVDGACVACRGNGDCAAGCCDASVGECGVCVFATSVEYVGRDLGGVAGGDAMCEERAKAAGLPGVYMAWLSDQDTSPAARFTRSSLPYVRPDGVRVADDWDDLTTCEDGNTCLRAPIEATETGAAIQFATVWTGTNFKGDPFRYDEFTPRPAEENCAGWTGIGYAVVGDSSDAGDSWTSWRPYSPEDRISCGNDGALYCFQQPNA